MPTRRQFWPSSHTAPHPKMQSLAERGVKPLREPSTTYSAFRCSAAHKIRPPAGTFLMIAVAAAR
jgi:hypothetical protein